MSPAKQRPGPLSTRAGPAKRLGKDFTHNKELLLVYNIMYDDLCTTSRRRGREVTKKLNMVLKATGSKYNLQHVAEALWKMLPQLCDYYLGTRNTKGVFELSRLQPVPPKLDPRTQSIRLPEEYDVVCRTGKFRAGGDPNLFQLLFDEHPTKSMIGVSKPLYLDVMDLPAPVRRWIQSPGSMLMHGSSLSSTMTTPPLVQRWKEQVFIYGDYDDQNSSRSYDTFATQLNYGSTGGVGMGMNGGGMQMAGISSSAKHLPLNPREYFLVRFLRAPDLKGKRQRSGGAGGGGGFFSSPFKGSFSSQGALMQKRKKMYKNLLLYGYTEYQVWEPYCCLLAQYLDQVFFKRDFFKMRGQFFEVDRDDSFHLDEQTNPILKYIVLCWFWPLQNVEQSSVWQFSPELGTGIMTFLVFILYHDRNELREHGWSHNLSYLQPHLFCLFKTIISHGFSQNKEDYSFDMTIDMWLLYLMPWYAETLYLHNARRPDSKMLNEGNRGPMHGTKNCYQFDSDGPWCEYVRQNFKFYDAILEIFLRKELDLNADNGHLEIFERVMFFFTPELQTFLQKVKLESLNRHHEYVSDTQLFVPNQTGIETFGLGLHVKGHLKEARQRSRVSTLYSRMGIGQAKRKNYTENELVPQWDPSGRLNKFGKKQVHEGKRVGSTLRWLEKNRQFIYSRQADGTFLLEDPLNVDYYSYEVPFLVWFFVSLSKLINSFLGYEFMVQVQANKFVTPREFQTYYDDYKSSAPGASNDCTADHGGYKDNESDPAAGFDIVESMSEQEKNEIWRKLWSESPEYSFYKTAILGTSFAKQGMKKVSGGNKETRINHLLRMNHGFFGLEGNLPPPVQPRPVVDKGASMGKKLPDNPQATPSESKSTEESKTPGEEKVGRRRVRRDVKPADPRDFFAIPVYPRIKWRIDLRFLADVRVYVFAALVYVLWHYVILGFFSLFAEEEHGSGFAQRTETSKMLEAPAKAAPKLIKPSRPAPPRKPPAQYRGL